jgi:hypothetical protein
MPKTTLDSHLEHPGTRVRTLGNASGVYNVSSTPLLAGHTTTQRVTTNTPNFRLIHRDDLPMNPFTYHSQVHRWPEGVTHEKERATGEWWETTGVISHGYVNLEPREITAESRAAIENSALSKAQGKVKNQKLSLGVTFGELKETSKLLLDTARRLAVSLGALAGGDPVTAVRTLYKGDMFDYYGHTITKGGVVQFYDRRSGNKIGSVKTHRTAIAEQFLSIRFGWMPLLEDLYKIFEHAARLLSEEGFSVRTSASTTRRFNVSSEEVFEGLPIIRREFGQQTCKYTFVYRQGYPDALLHLKQVGVTNPLGALYQLKSLSFIFDWFLPMGRYLDLLDYDLGLQYIRGCKTVFEKTTVRYKVAAAGYVPATNRDVYGKWSAYKQVVDCVRTPIAGFPSVPLPRINPNPLGPERGGSLVALLQQRLKPFKG